MVLLVATRELRYAAKQYMTGDRFEASDKDARILKGIKKAKDAPVQVIEPVARAVMPEKTAKIVPPTPVVVEPKVVELKAPEPVPVEPKAAEPKVEEVVTPESKPEVGSEEVSEDTVVKKPAGGPTSTTTRYRRRDLQPQE